VSLLPDVSQRGGWVRPLLRTACVAWLLVGIFQSIEGFGIPPHVPWRPVGMVIFLGLNAFAGGVVVAECLVLIRPDWEARRVWLTKAVMLALFIASLVYYLAFVHTHAVGIY
jgi:hypothetical protein